MTPRDAPVQPSCTDDWSPDNPAVEVENLLDGQGRRYVALLRHPAYPFTCQVAHDSNTLPQRLREVAMAYLERIAGRVGIASLASQWQQGRGPGFGWLDIGWGQGVPESAQDPQASFWVERVASNDEGGGDADGVAQGPAFDRTAVLLATYRALEEGSGRQFSLGSGIGLSVVLHVGPASDGQHRVRITGASFSAGLIRVLSSLAERDWLSYGDEAREAAAAAFGFDLQRTALSGLVPSAGDAPTVRVSGTAWGVPGKEDQVFAWAARFNKCSGIQREFVAELVAHATQGAIEVFPQDPASCGPAETLVSRRPTRRSSLLDGFRHPTSRLPPDLPLVLPGGVPCKRLVSRGTKPWFAVRQSPLGKDPAQADPAAVQSVPSDTLALRGDDLAAVHAYLRGDELFQRLAAYGLRPARYFKHARLPLLLRHHSPLRGAADGQAVNADVRPIQSGNAAAALAPNPPRPQLEVRFGAANLWHRDVARADAGRPRPQVLGLAADPRWAWHEFGHVLAYAATGALEFDFAHSAGDALAAILGDPDSALSQDGTMRMRTFPWVPTGRRHDRPAALGWCWCGRRNTRRQSQAAAGRPRLTGYFAEQLLSSSLFRLYRAIGGDTFASRDTRCAAADYTVYLVMRAMALLGPVGVLRAASPDHFVCALMHADVGTGTWTAAPPWPQGMPSPRPRVGGAMHKVVRWAFEQQGLYATALPGAVVEGVGQPRAADVYIAGVPAGAGRTAGGYDPVPLDWVADPDAAPPGWHSDPHQGIWWQGGQVHVKVNNRGTQQVNGVAVRAWAALAALSPLSWQELDIQPGGQGVLSVAGSTTFKFDGPVAAAPPNAAWLVLAAASCTGDPSNLDPLTGLPGAAAGPPDSPELLTDLVACDNNLGLRAMRLPP